MTGVFGTDVMVAATLRRPAVVAGVGMLLIALPAGLGNFGVVAGLVTADDPSTTATTYVARVAADQVPNHHLRQIARELP